MYPHPTGICATSAASGSCKINSGTCSVFLGGLDVRILESRDRDHIKKEIAGYLEGMKHRGARLVFGSDHSLSTNIDYEDFLFALEVYREHQAY